jgi:hypothetical protein
MASYTYTVTNSGNDAYVIDGELNPPLALTSGNRYIFNVNAPGHPFYIKTDRVLGDGSVYDFQVTGNGTDVGTVIIELPDGPEPKLFYQCGTHLKMGGSLTNVQHINKGIQNLIGEQLPGFVSVEYPMFQKFLEAYYEWMSLPGNVDDNTQNILKYQDVDSSIDLYLSELEKEFLNQVPKDIDIDKATLIKNIRSFYTSKGTEKSYEFLFNVLFNENVEFYYPKNDILRTSDGKWTTNVSIRLTNPSNYNVFDLVGQKISQDYLYVDPDTNAGEIRVYATAVVQRIIQFFLGDTLITEAYISNYESVDGGDFLVSTSEDVADQQVVYIFDELRNKVEFPVQPMSVDIKVIDSGSGYSVNQILPIQTAPGDDGIGAIATISSVFTGEVEGLSIINSGTGYKVGDNVQFINEGTGGIGASGFVTRVSESGMKYSSGDSGFQGAGTNTSRLTDTEVATWAVGNNYARDYTFTVIGEGTFNYDLSVTDLNGDGQATINYLEIYVGDTDAEVNDPGAVPAYSVYNDTTSNASGSFTIPDVAYIRIRYQTELTSIEQDPEYWDPDAVPTSLDVTTVLSSFFTGTGQLKGLRLQSGGSGYVKIPVARVTSEFGTGGAIRALGPNIGAIKNARILNQNFGALYYETPTIDTSTLGNGDAVLEVVTGSVANHPGSFRNDDGHLSAAKYLQDNKYYQAFSYVLRTGLSISDYRDTVKKLVHPAGMELFGEVFITQNLATAMFSNFENDPNDLIVRPDLGGIAIPRYKKVVLKFETFLNDEASGAYIPTISSFIPKIDTKYITLNMGFRGITPEDLQVFSFPKLQFPIQRDIENIIIDNTIEVGKSIVLNLWNNYNTIAHNGHTLNGLNHDETTIEDLSNLYERIKDYNDMSLHIAHPIVQIFPKYVLSAFDELIVEVSSQFERTIDLDINSGVDVSQVITRQAFGIDAIDVQVDALIKNKRIISKEIFARPSMMFELQREIQTNTQLNITGIPVNVEPVIVEDDVNVIQITLGDIDNQIDMDSDAGNNLVSKRVISKDIFARPSMLFELQREIQSNTQLNITGIPVNVEPTIVEDDINVIQIILGYKELRDFTRGFDTSGDKSVIISDVENQRIKDLDKELNTVMDVVGEGIRYQATYQIRTEVNSDISSTIKRIIDKDIDSTGRYVTTIHASVPVESIIKLQPVTLEVPLVNAEVSIAYNKLNYSIVKDIDSTVSTQKGDKKVLSLVSDLTSESRTATQVRNTNLFKGFVYQIEDDLIETYEDYTIRDLANSQLVSVTVTGFTRDSGENITGNL